MLHSHLLNKFLLNPLHHLQLMLSTAAVQSQGLNEEEKPNMLEYSMNLSSPPESLAAFCLCNLIIALLLLISFRGATSVNCTGELPATVPCVGSELEKPEKVSVFLIEVNASTNKEENRWNEEEDDEEEEEETELMRRAEDFIQRMVRMWEAEKNLRRV